MQQGTGRRLGRILLTNDDGIDAPGLALAEQVAADLADEVWTVAPSRDYSGGSRQLSLHQALRLIPQGERRFSLTGSPADCVFVGLGWVLKNRSPDLVISGVNAGVNIGGDLGFSGTVGAAMTAHSLGVPAVALSQAWKGSRDDIPWETAQTWLPRVLDGLLGNGLWPWRFVPNINVPAVTPDRVTGFEITQQGHSAHVVPAVERRVDLRGQEYFWIYMHKENDAPLPDEDIAALRRNAVSVTPLGHDTTSVAAIEELRRIFA